jgi:hypothetical protein
MLHRTTRYMAPTNTPAREFVRRNKKRAATLRSRRVVDTDGGTRGGRKCSRWLISFLQRNEITAAGERKSAVSRRSTKIIGDCWNSWTMSRRFFNLFELES